MKTIEIAEKGVKAAEESARAAWLTVAITFALLVVGGVQAGFFWTQLKSMKESSDLAFKALSFEARPYIYPNIEFSVYKDTPSLEETVRRFNGVSTFQMGFSEIVLSLHNAGRSSGVLKALEWKIVAWPRGSSFTEGFDSSALYGRELPALVVVGDTRSFEEPLRLDAQLDSNDLEQIKGAYSSIWVTGFARYDDLLGDHYIIGFTQVLDLKSQKFITRGGDTLNYSRKETSENIQLAKMGDQASGTKG